MLETYITMVLVAVAAALLTHLYQKKKDDNYYPPGPWTLPYLGNLLQITLAGSMVKFCEKYKKIFGNVYTIEVGGHKRVVISGFKAIHELIVKKADYTSVRSPKSLPKHVQQRSIERPGIFFAPYPHWKMIRSFSITTLREEGMGKARIEPKILEEVEHFMEYYIDANLDTPLDIGLNLHKATCNLISQLLFGERSEYSDDDFTEMIKAMDVAVRLTAISGQIQNLPLINYIGSHIIGKYEQAITKIIFPGMQQRINEHKISVDHNSPRDVIDRYLIHQKKTGDTKCFSDANALVVAFHMYVAGAETTSTALQWALLHMGLNPGIQEKVHQEIEEQLGQKGAVSYKDHLRMPFTDAVILETLRLGNISPIALPHTTQKKFEIDGKVIPAGSDILMNMASILHDEEVFEEPKVFKPERYLTGDIALKKQRTIPFSIGRRACLGESLARMELFIFFVLLMQRYSISIENPEEASIEPVTATVNYPKPFKAIFSSR